MTEQRYVEMPIYKTWGTTGDIVWADDGSGTPWLAEAWRCRQTGEIEFKPLRMVKVPAQPIPDKRGEE